MMCKAYRYGYTEPYRLDPTPLYAKLRSEEPVARVASPYGEECWLVTRHESVKTVLADARFSRAAVITAGEQVPRASSFTPGSNPISALDPPEHTRLRQLIAGAFTKRQAKRHRPRAHQIANELIDGMIATGPPVDLGDTFAERFPIMLIGEIFGVPRSDRVQFREWAVPVLSRTAYPKQEVEAAKARLLGYLASLVARKRERPEDDLLTTLLLAHANKQHVTEEELISVVVSLLLNDSIANQITSFLYLLLTHADQLTWLRAHMSRVPQAVEELLRFAPLAADVAGSGANGHTRMATADVDMDGVTIRAGDFVLPSITSANRDERVFADAHKLDLTRTRNPHLAFGYGTHHCPGAELSRMEMQVAMTSLLTRFPNLRLAVPVHEVPWKVGLVVRGPERLPVQW
jgi:cytochrome P450